MTYVVQSCTALSEAVPILPNACTRLQQTSRQALIKHGRKLTWHAAYIGKPSVWHRPACMALPRPPSLRPVVLGTHADIYACCTYTSSNLCSVLAHSKSCYKAADGVSAKGEVVTSVAPHHDGRATPSSVASCRTGGTAANTVNSRSPNSSFASVSACQVSYMRAAKP